MNQIITLQANTILTPEVKADIETQVADAVRVADAAREAALDITVIDSQAMLDIASDTLRNIATGLKRLDERRKELTRPMDETKSFVVSLFDAPKTRLQDGESHLRKLVKNFMDAEAARVAEERRKLEAQQAEERRQAAERQRIADEEARAKQAEAERLRQEAEAGNAEAVAAAEEAEAEAQEAAGAAQEAAEVAEVAEITHAPVVQAAKASGVATRSKWVVKEADVDMLALVKAAAEDPKLLIYLLPDMTRLRQYVTMMKGEAKVPGVTFREESVLSVRSVR